MIRTLPLLSAALMLAACSDGAPDQPVGSDAAIPADAASGASLAEGQSAPIMLDVILPDDLAAEPLVGELGCSFSFSRTDDPLLVAKGFVDSQSQAMGAVKIDGTVMRLAKEGAGGFGDMPSGASFTNGTVNVRVEVTGEARSRCGAERKSAQDRAADYRTRHAPDRDRWVLCLRAVGCQSVSGELGAGLRQVGRMEYDLFASMRV